MRAKDGGPAFPRPLSVGLVLLAISLAVVFFCIAIVEHSEVKPTQDYEEFGDYFK